jgi:hypothetical protein
MKPSVGGRTPDNHQDHAETTQPGHAALRRPQPKSQVSTHDRVSGTHRVRTCRRELLDRTLIYKQRHLLHALRAYEAFYNTHGPHQGIANARPLNPLPEPITDPDRLTHLDIRRRDRLAGILHKYEHAA